MVRRSPRSPKKPDYYTGESPTLSGRKVGIKKGGVVKKTAVQTPVALAKQRSSSLPLATLVKQKSSKKIVAKAKKVGLKTVKAPKAVREKKPRHPNDKLTPRPDVTIYTKDPTFELKEELPFVSVEAYSKLSIRAVLMGNEALLKRLIDDTKHVSTVHKPRSVDIPKTALDYALEKENWKFIDMLFKDNKHPKQNRIQELPSLMPTAGTGQYNIHMLGHAVRPIQMGRGGKEGINALLKEPNDNLHYGMSGEMTAALQNNIGIGTIQQMIAKQYISDYEVNQHIFNAVRYGNRKLAGKLVDLYGHGGFNELHKEVLLNDKQNLKQFKPISVKKKGQLGNKSVSPLHCACINPNEKYLEELIKAEPDFNTPDDNNRRPLHYAAACETTGPMKVLLKKGVSIFDVDKQGNLPLHAAAETGRDQCLDLLCQEMLKDDQASLGRKNRQGYAAVHLAAKNGHLGVLKTMAKHGADLELQTGAARNKMTALMFAAQAGHLGVVQWLIESQKAIVDKRDKLKRTALLVSVMNGNAHVVSYLLRVGSNVDLPDSSGNTPAHYAAAYGWYFCMKLLVEAEAELNKPNDWQLTPLAVSYMKGHMGLTDLLLGEEGIDINCQDEKGLTLVSLTLSNRITKSSLDQLNYLVKDKKADCTIADSLGNNALHHLAAATYATSTNFSGPNQDEARQKEEIKVFLDIAKLLIDNGCYVNHMNEEKSTPITLAVATGKVNLAELLFKNGGLLPGNDNPLNGEDNVLHCLAKCTVSPMAALFLGMVKKQPRVVKTLLSSTGTDGCTPLLRACKSYSESKEPKKTPGRIAFRSPFPTPFHAGSPIGGLNPQQVKDSKVVAARQNLRDLIKEILNFAPQCLMHQVNKEAKRIQYTAIDEDQEEMDDDDDEYEGSDIEEDDDESNDAAFDQKKQDSAKSKLTDKGQTAFHLAVHAEKGQQNEGQQEKPLLSLMLKAYDKNTQILKNSKGHSILELKDDNQQTALMAAVIIGDTKAAEMLLQAGAAANSCMTRPSKEPDLSKMISDAHPFTPENEKADEPNNVSVLMKAVEMKLGSIVQLLLQHGAVIHWRDSNGNTALHYAAKETTSDMADIMKILLENGASPAAANAKQRTALHLACNADTGSADVSTQVAELLLKSGADSMVNDIRGRKPLHYAFVKIGKHKESSAIDPIALCQVLLSNMPRSPRPLAQPSDIYGKTPLHYAAGRGSNICTMTMLRHTPELLDVADGEKNRPLGLAVNNGHMACALTLIQANADVNCTTTKWGDGKYDTPEDWSKENKWKWGPFRASYPQLLTTAYTNSIVKNEWQGIVYVVLDLMQNDWTCLVDLVKAAIEHKKYNLALTLLRIVKSKTTAMKNVNLNSGAFENNLFYLLAKTAVTSDPLQIKVADALHKLGVMMLDAKNQAKPAVQAAKNHNYPLLEFFEQHISNGSKVLACGDPSDNGLSPFSALVHQPCSSSQCRKWMQKLSSAGKYNGTMPLGMYPMPFDSTDQEWRTGIRNTGQDPPLMDTTCLIRAIQVQNFDLCKFLITKLHADINQTDNNGLSPAMMAAKVNNTDIVKLLLNHNYEVQASGGEHDGEDSDGDDEEGIPEARAIGTGVVPLPKSQFSADTVQLEKMLDHDDEGEQNEEDEDEAEEDDEDYGPQTNQSRKRKKKSKKPLFAKPKKKKKGPSAFYFKKTSNVDLTLKDIRHRTVIHHCVIPFEWGSWENAELVKMLVKYGGPVNSFDVEHKTPMDYAVQNGQKIMADTLKNLMKSNQTYNMSYDQFKITRSKSKTMTISSWNEPDIDSDSAKFLGMDAERRKKQQEEKGLEAKEKLERRPHVLSGYQHTGELVRCTETNEICKVLLNKVDVHFGMFGFYNFYRLELIRRKGSQLYIVFTNWGRIGDEGQYQRTPFGKLEDAQKEFRSIFRSKTGNDWSSLGNFTELPKKYKLVHQDTSSMEATNIGDLDIGLDTSLKPKLPQEIVTLMKDIADVGGLRNNTKRVHSRFNFLLPFGRIQKEKVLAAQDLLKEICENILDLDKMRQDIQEQKNLEKAQRIMNDLATLSNQFYEMIPFGGLSHAQVPVIDNHNLLTEFTNVVHSLFEFELAGKILAGAALKKQEVHPLDYIFQSLNTDIQLIDPDTYDAQYILHYIYNSSQNTRVQGIYKVFNEQRNANFDPKDIGNRRMLWHGTSAANLISILKLGLLSAPPQSLHHGYLFGKGIYLADVFAKSLGYCQSHSGSNMKYMLLCEVAMGNTFVADSATNQTFFGCVQLQKGKHSVKGMGQQVPDPNYDVTLKTGAKVALGNKLVAQVPEKNHYYFLPYNEYIVYDPSQVVIRYIIAFK